MKKKYTEQKFNIYNFSPREGEKGFTLLLAALIASIVLALGTSIFSLVQKELVLSSISRDSQYAFYAADSGAECALYWDVRHRLFLDDNPPDEITCDGQTVPVTVTFLPPETTFTFQYESNGYCVDVTVIRSVGPNYEIRTLIHADGFNRDCDSISNSSRVLQRSVELHY